MSVVPVPHRPRTKTTERSSHSSRQASKEPDIVVPLVGIFDLPPEEKEKHKYRRSMLPFLGRKRNGRSSPSSSPMPRKSTNTPSGPVRNGQILVTVTSTTDGSPYEPPLPSSLPPLNVSPSSLGSKFAAHFTPLRSPTRTLKARYSSSHKSANTPPVPSSTMLSPPPSDYRGPSMESHTSGVQSRSTTPKPLRQHSVESSACYEVEDDFSDLFTLPQPRPKQTKSAQKASHLSPVNVDAASGSVKTAQHSPASPLTPASPTPPSTPRLQFPIPPSFDQKSLVGDKFSPQRSQQPSRTGSTAPSYKGSNSSLRLPVASPQRSLSSHDTQSDRGTTADERDCVRAISLSGSDTDASRATDGSASSTRPRQQSVSPKGSALRHPTRLQHALPSSEKLPSGPAPSIPLPSPPPSAPLRIGPSVASIKNVPSYRAASPRISPRPRANTLSSTTALSSAKLAAWMAPRASPQNKNINAEIPVPSSSDEHVNALAVQRRKYAQLQEYAVSITKQFEDERKSMNNTIQMLEREVRKKVREIEGLRWLVIHNGGADDIDAAANLARASLVTLDDGDRVTTVQAMDAMCSQAPSQSTRTTTNTSVASADCDGGITGPTRSRSGLGLDFIDSRGPSRATLEPPSPEFGTTASPSSSRSSLSLPVLTPSTTSSLSAIPEQPVSGKGEISRAERQKAKEARRASRALRRISSSSMSSVASGALMAPPPLPIDQKFGPQYTEYSMHNVLEKLRPFRNT